jgi:hypothetical protein
VTRLKEQPAEIDANGNLIITDEQGEVRVERFEGQLSQQTFVEFVAEERVLAFCRHVATHIIHRGRCSGRQVVHGVR